MAKTKMMLVRDANDAQLADFFTSKMNFQIHGEPTREKLLAALDMGGFSEDSEIEVNPTLGAPMEVKPQVAGQRIKRRVEDASDAEADKLVTIMIAMEKRGNSKAGKEPVPVIHNGTRIDIPRGKAVQVKQKYAWVLMDAATVVYDPLPGDLGGVSEGEEIPSYPVSYMGPVAA